MSSMYISFQSFPFMVERNVKVSILNCVSLVLFRHKLVLLNGLITNTVYICMSHLGGKKMQMRSVNTDNVYSQIVIYC